jgi:hypothetical protein
MRAFFHQGTLYRDDGETIEVRNYTPIHLDDLTREVRKASTYLP